MQTMAEKDYYEILGVKRKASADELKKAYKKLVRKYHPDVNQDNPDADKKFKEVGQAYSILKEPEKRKMYDQFGHAAFSNSGDPRAYGGGPGRNPYGGGNPFGGAGQNMHFDFGDLGNTGNTGNIGDLFGNLFGQGRPRRRRPTKGRDVESKLRLDFVSAIEGTTTEFEMTHHQPCTHCSGSGTGPQGAPCPICGGRAFTPRRDKLKVRIPAGADNGSRVRVPGKGEPSQSGGPPGDLFVVIEVAPHPLFTREGDHLTVEVPVTVYEAAQGASIEVPTINGSASMTIPAGTKNGQKFRLKGKGVSRRKKKGHGNLFVIARIELPPKLDKKALELLKQFDEHTEFNPRSTDDVK
jgi:molecular chaperone DnaJ